VSRRVVGLDLGGSTARLLEGRLEKGAFAIHQAVAVPVEDLAETVAELKLAGVPVVVGITGRDMILRTNQVPPVPLPQLRELMAFEVADIAEQSGDALRADFSLLAGAAAFSDESMVLLALVRSSVVDERSAALAAARLKVAGFTPNAVALHNAVVATDGGAGTVMVVGMRGQNTDIALIHEGDLLFARNLAGGGDTLTEAVAEALRLDKPAAERLKQQVGVFAAPGETLAGQTAAVARSLEGALRPLVGMLQSTMVLARNQLQATQLDVERVLLCGPGAALPGLDQALQRTLGLPVARFDPTEGYVVGEAPELEEHGGDFAVATGLAMMALLEGSTVVQVLSEAAEKARRFREKTLWLVLAGVLLAVHLGLYAWSSHRDYQAASSDRLLLSRQVEANKSERLAYERALQDGQDLAARLGALADVAGPGAGLLYVLDLLEASLPDELWVTSVRTVRAPEPGFQRGNAVLPYVIVEGGGKELERNLNDAVVEFTTRLRSDPHVAAVLPQPATDARGNFSFELRIDTALIPPAEAAADAAGAAPGEPEGQG